LAITDFFLFGQLKQQLSGRILDSEENVLKTMTEIMSELPKDETKVRWCIGEKDASGSQTTMESSIRISETPSYFDIVRVILRPDI
jgi:hypothetical protein